MPTISIIIPVYKVEKYIRTCLDSILNQTFTDWEALLIDDGSPDNCGAICDEYATKDGRFRVFHKVNGGVSSARNLGIKKAQGEYITFVDSDDMLHSNTLDICINTIKTNNLDLLQFGFTQSGDYILGNPKPKGIVLTSQDFFKINHNVSIWGEVIKRDVLVNNNIQFIEGMKYAEDQVFVLHSILNSKRLMKIEDKLYYYRDNIESATHNEHPEDLYSSCKVLAAEKKHHPEFARVIDNTIIIMVLSIIAKSSDNMLLINTKKLYKQAKVNNCNKVYNSGRIFYWIAKIDFNLAKFAYRLYTQIRGVY